MTKTLSWFQRGDLAVFPSASVDQKDEGGRETRLLVRIRMNRIFSGTLLHSACVSCLFIGNGCTDTSLRRSSCRGGANHIKMILVSCISSAFRREPRHLRFGVFMQQLDRKYVVFICGGMLKVISCDCTCYLFTFFVVVVGFFFPFLLQPVSP